MQFGLHTEFKQTIRTLRGLPALHDVVFAHPIRNFEIGGYYSSVLFMEDSHQAGEFGIQGAANMFAVTHIG